MRHTLAKLIHHPLVDTINKIVIPMQAAIITIGDEILIGQVVDTNSSWISRALSDIGIAVKKMWSVGDESYEIILGLDQALAVEPAARLADELAASPQGSATTE